MIDMPPAEQPPRQKWKLGDPIPVIVRQAVVEVYLAKSRWKRSKYHRYSQLACRHTVDHGIERARRAPYPIVADQIVCRRCTMAARRRASLRAVYEACSR